MSNIIKRNANTITATTYLPMGAYKALVQLARDHEGEIDKTAKGMLRVTFDEVQTAKNVANRFSRDYKKAHEAYVPKPAAKRVRQAKGKAFDFTKIKGNTTKEKNKALHATLVGMGITNSKSDEYMSVWNARPWAN